MQRASDLLSGRLRARMTAFFKVLRAISLHLECHHQEAEAAYRSGLDALRQLDPGVRMAILPFGVICLGQRGKLEEAEAWQGELEANPNPGTLGCVAVSRASLSNTPLPSKPEEAYTERLARKLAGLRVTDG